MMIQQIPVFRNYVQIGNFENKLLKMQQFTAKESNLDLSDVFVTKDDLKCWYL